MIKNVVRQIGIILLNKLVLGVIADDQACLGDADEAGGHHQDRLADYERLWPVTLMEVSAG